MGGIRVFKLYNDINNLQFANWEFSSNSHRLQIKKNPQNIRFTIVIRVKEVQMKHKGINHNIQLSNWDTITDTVLRNQTKK